MECGLHLCDSQQGLVAGSFEHSNDPSSSIKGKEFHE
jgi:hypothetical protein